MHRFSLAYGLLLMLGLAVPLSAQTATPWAENWDSYAAGIDPTNPSVGGWEQWDLAPASVPAFVSAARSLSAPHSLANAGDSDVVQRFSEAAGQWTFETWIYVPGGGQPDELTVDTWFIMLNTFTHGAAAPKNWSLQLSFDPATGLASFIGGPNNGLTLPFAFDQWFSIQVVVDLDNPGGAGSPNATVFLDGVQFGPDFDWSEGVSGGGLDEIQALDLWSNQQNLGTNPNGTAYYDDMLLSEAAMFWNRGVDQILFSGMLAPPGNVTVHVDWALEADATVSSIDLSTELQLWINGSLSTTIPVTALSGLLGGCPGPPCDYSQCSSWTINSMGVGGVCAPSSSENCAPPPRCVCRCDRRDSIAGNTLMAGDLVEARLVPAGAGLPELVTCEDTLMVTFTGVTPATLFCTAKSTLACGIPVIDAIGLSSASATSGFLVSAAPARTCKSGILLYNSSSGPAIPFQGGVLCVNTMSLRRAGSTNSMGTPGPANCDGSFSIDMNAFAAGAWIVPSCGGGPTSTPTSTPAAYLSIPGTSIFAQFWGRDSLATGSYVSDGVSWTIAP